MFPRPLEDKYVPLRAAIMKFFQFCLFSLVTHEFQTLSYLHSPLNLYLNLDYLPTYSFVFFVLSKDSSKMAFFLFLTMDK